MMKKEYSEFKKGDVILTSPEPGYWGIAVVLDDGVRLVEGSRLSIPMCHIAITPLIFNHMISMEDIQVSQLKPLVFLRYANLHGTSIPFREEIMVHIYSTRNIYQLPVIGKVDPLNVYQGKLSWEPQDNIFHLCGDIDSRFGGEAYTKWVRNNK